MSLAVALHVLSVVIWVGGMFFAYMALRPAAAALLEPPARLTLWRAVFSKFFPWVWAAVILILASGYWIIFGVYGGMANAPLFVHVMHGSGLVMMLIFFHVFFAPYRRLTRAVSDSRWPDGGKALNQIRMLIGINLLIGLLTITLATAGKYLI
ncbi:MAG: CopD family protein [Thiolinea sp.]